MIRLKKEVIWMLVFVAVLIVCPLYVQASAVKLNRTKAIVYSADSIQLKAKENEGTVKKNTVKHYYAVLADYLKDNKDKYKDGKYYIIQKSREHTYKIVYDSAADEFSFIVDAKLKIDNAIAKERMCVIIDPSNYQAAYLNCKVVLHGGFGDSKFVGSGFFNPKKYKEGARLSIKYKGNWLGREEEMTDSLLCSVLTFVGDEIFKADLILADLGFKQF